MANKSEILFKLEVLLKDSKSFFATGDNKGTYSVYYQMLKLIEQLKEDIPTEGLKRGKDNKETEEIYQFNKETSDNFDGSVDSLKKMFGFK